MINQICYLTTILLRTYLNMRYFFIATYLLAFCSLAACGCVDVTFQTTVGAYNNLVNIYGNTSLQSTILSFLANISAGDAPFSTTTEYINGSYEINGELCEPTSVVPGLPPTLQLLVHGLGYNHAYWKGLNPQFISSNGSSYSWVEYARAQGYYTLAIDRLGSGMSSRPDPIRVLQIPMEVEVLHSIISQLRQGTTTYFQPFDRIVYVSHSYGSALGNHLAATYPDDADDFVLTGWSAKEPNMKGSPGLTTLLPAANLSMAFTGLAAGYLAVTTASAVEKSLYAGGYDPTLPRVDYAVEDTTGLSQLVAVTGFQNASSFQGGVFVVTGENDGIVCSEGCSSGNWVAQGLEYFPSAQVKDYLLVPFTGHDINLHFSAPYSWEAVHKWLRNRI